MAAVDKILAEKVKDVIAAMSLSEPFVARRAHRAHFKMPDHGEGTADVPVVPVRWEMQRDTRGHAMHFYTLHVGILVKLQNNADQDRQVDRWRDFTDDMVLQLAGEVIGSPLRLADGNRANCRDVQNDPILIAEHLESYGQYSSIVVLRFSVRRERQ